MVAVNDFNVAPEFHVVVDVTAQPPRVAVSGELDLVTCAPFRDALAEAIEFNTDTVVVDFKRLTFLGSTGIREMVRALEQVKRVEIRSPAPIVRRALEAAGLGDNVVITG
jgi:anti-anti-sigma factor